MLNEVRKINDTINHNVNKCVRFIHYTMEQDKIGTLSHSFSDTTQTFSMEIREWIEAMAQVTWLCALRHSFVSFLHSLFASRSNIKWVLFVPSGMRICSNLSEPVTCRSQVMLGHTAKPDCEISRKPQQLAWISSVYVVLCMCHIECLCAWQVPSARKLTRWCMVMCGSRAVDL